MKNNLLFLLVVTFSIFSCETSKDAEESNSKVNGIETIKTLTPEKQREAFQELSNEDKAKLWNEKIEFVLKHRTLNEKQKMVFGELKNLIVPELYDKNSPKSIVIIDFMKHWTPKANLVFNKQELVDYLMTLNFSKIIIQNPPPCACSKESDWCVFSDCTGEFTCVGEIDGCGAYWAYACDGECN